MNIRPVETRNGKMLFSFDFRNEQELDGYLMDIRLYCRNNIMPDNLKADLQDSLKKLDERRDTKYARGNIGISTTLFGDEFAKFTQALSLVIGYNTMPGR